MSDDRRERYAAVQAADDARRARYACAARSALEAFIKHPYSAGTVTDIANAVVPVADEEIQRSHDQLFSRYAAKILIVEQAHDEAVREVNRLRTTIRRATDVLTEWYGTSDADALWSAISEALGETA
ncbi:hypothetical protein OG709_29960 [Streptomyces sp. NBC_01267]|uniref:hypothetical protein n=1 Tax=Streptomyces sp. NBC_01267 TaxID=2903805 RepID=UPI002E37CE7F|nr:hypothetical protein [Streptomyces sp. NBC_01267]